jgi:hypothetical protein
MKFISNLTSQHIARYPNLELIDLYKLLHQSALGASHASAADDILEKEFNLEWDNLTGVHVEPAIDPISPDGKIARIHLRSYLSQDYSKDDLLTAFIRTANAQNGSQEKLKKFCNCLRDLSKAKQLPFNPEDTEAFLNDVENKDYPTLRHSNIFKKEYEPSYRIVHLDYLLLTKVGSK